MQACEAPKAILSDDHVVFGDELARIDVYKRIDGVVMVSVSTAGSQTIDAAAQLSFLLRCAINEARKMKRRIAAAKP